jgi:NADH-quinone oxidoreductase subunit N
MNLTLLLPEIILAAAALLAVLADLLSSRKGWVTVVSLAGIAAAFGSAIALSGQEPQAVWQGLLAVDRLAFFMKLIFLGLSALIILASVDYVKCMGGFHGEYHALILLSTLGMMLLASSSSLITIFVSLELVSVPIYALAGFLKDQRGTESALKYILLSAVNSAVLLYGLALVFGFTGETSLAGVAGSIGALSASGVWAQPGLLFGLALVLAGFGFKIAAVPFHMWAPDVYEGSPTPVALLLSAGSKLAGFAVLLRVLVTAFQAPMELSQGWGLILAVISALGMTLGNLLAIPQTNIKRLLAYSGIAHSGYMLAAVAAAGVTADIASASALLLYMLAFALAEVAAFTAVTIASGRISDNIADYAGLGKRSPWLAAGLTVGLISLTGIPPAAGFIAKFYVFTEAFSAGLAWLVIIAVLNTVISAYYYLRVIRLMWLGEPAGDAPVTASGWPKAVLLLSVIGVLALGSFPFWGVKLAEFGATILLP